MSGKVLTQEIIDSATTMHSGDKLAGLTWLRDTQGYDLGNVDNSGSIIDFSQGGSYGNYANDVTNKTSAYEQYGKSPYDGLKYGENRITGGYGLDTSAAWFGGKNNTGIISGVNSAIGTAATIGKTMLAYDQFEQSKEDNAKKFALMQESNLMKRTQMHNRVAEARRRTAGGLNSANSQTATLHTAIRNPYLDAQYSKIG